MSRPLSARASWRNALPGMWPCSSCATSCPQERSWSCLSPSWARFRRIQSGGLAGFCDEGRAAAPSSANLAKLWTASIAILGPCNFPRVYQQQPLPAEGNLVSREWFRSYDALPSRTATRRIVQSWDVATTLSDSNDYSVCTTWQVSDGRFYLLHVFRARLKYPALRRKVIARGGYEA